MSSFSINPFSLASSRSAPGSKSSATDSELQTETQRSVEQLARRLQRSELTSHLTKRNHSVEDLTPLTHLVENELRLSSDLSAGETSSDEAVDVKKKQKFSDSVTAISETDYLEPQLTSLRDSGGAVSLPIDALRDSSERLSGADDSVQSAPPLGKYIDAAETAEAYQIPESASFSDKSATISSEEKDEDSGCETALFESPIVNITDEDLLFANTQYEGPPILTIAADDLSKIPANFKSEESEKILSKLDQVARGLVLLAKQSNHMVAHLIDGNHVFVQPSGKIYLSIDLLGSGCYKSAYKTLRVASSKAAHLTNDNLSTKVISITRQTLSDKELKEIARESAVHDKLWNIRKERGKEAISHVAVGHAFSVVSTKQRIAIKAEHAEGKDLQYWLEKNPLDFGEKIILMQEMAKGVAELHKLGIVHRDIKFDNFLVSLNDHGQCSEVKLGDLGKCIVADTVLTEAENTPLYKLLTPPELFTLSKELKLAAKTNPKLDIYQLGVCYYMLLTDTKMKDRIAEFPGEFDLKLKTYLANSVTWLDMIAIQPSVLRNFILRMTDRDPQNRPTITEVQEFFKRFSENPDAGLLT